MAATKMLVIRKESEDSLCSRITRVLSVWDCQPWQRNLQDTHSSVPLLTQRSSAAHPEVQMLRERTAFAVTLCVRASILLRERR